VRTYAGSAATSDSVRYQFSISETARECDVVNGQIAIKVGVSGRVLIGPAGAPGTYSVPVRIAIKREGADGVLASKLYPVTATIPPSEAGAPFTLVSEPMLVPFTREEAREDYSIIVGFDQNGRAAKPSKVKRHRAAAAE
jgi:hypothetical protein